MSQWPWSDLVSYVYRHARPTSSAFRVLELGCGAGANIPFFKSFGIQYFAVEGSGSVVAKLHQRFPEFAANIVEGDFTSSIPFDGLFDLVVDRAALTHNTTAAITRCLSRVRDAIKPGGTYLGIDWFSTEHSDFSGGEAAEDRNTRTGYSTSQFVGLGRVHFADRDHLENLFKGFEIVALDHKTSRSLIPGDGHVFASWNIAARRP
jgi:SAM-dependent methyltransferase